MLWYQKLELLPPRSDAPFLDLYDEKRQKFTMEQFRGKNPLLLCFCKIGEPVCHSQANYLNAIVQQYSHKGLEVIFIADSPSVEEVVAFDKEIDAEFVILRDKGGKAKVRYHVEALPTNYFIGKDGRVVQAYPHPIRSTSSQIRSLIKYLTGEMQ